jgi:hypothetical protein
MKRTDIKHLYDTYLSKTLSQTDYRLKRNFLVRVPIGNIFCGIVFSSSGFSQDAFYINAFAQPLYIPSDHIVLTFGREMPGYWEYSASDTQVLGLRVLKALEDHALPLHQSLSNLELFYRNVQTICSPKNIHLHQALVLTAIYLNKMQEAQEHFKILRRLVDESDPKIPWPRAVLDQTETFTTEAATDIGLARAHLQEVELATLRSLKLDDLPTKFLVNS